MLAALAVRVAAVIERSFTLGFVDRVGRSQ
jgi:hypothetical protein